MNTKNSPDPRRGNARVEKSLRHSLKDGAAYATMIGAGETYLSAFAVFLKASTPQIGLLASLPALLASFVQLLSAWLGKLTGKRQPIVLAGASLQALAWLPIMALPIFFREAAIPLLIASVVLYHCGAHLAAPQWSSMVGDIVPERRRGRFFGLRTQVVSLTTFLSLIAGGTVLHLFDSAGMTLAGFVVIFTVAMLARLVSVYHLMKMHDPKLQSAPAAATVDKGWLRRLRKSNFARFSVFFALMQFSVAISSPFFAVYLLRDLQFSYGLYMLNSGMSILAQFLTLSQWGRLSDVFGNRRTLSATGLLLPLMPLLWLFSADFFYLLFVQMLSGLAWAGFTLSAGNFLYDLIEREKRTTYLAVHNILASAGIFCGALIGGYLALVLPDRLQLGVFSWDWMSPMLGVFAISGIARAIVVLILLPRIREVRKVRHISFSNLIIRVTRAHALAGLVFEIVGSRNGSRREEAPPE